MTNVIDIQTGSPLADRSPEQDALQERVEAWNQLFKALEKLKGDAQKRDFARVGFKDPEGVTWSAAALVRKADSMLAYLRRATGGRA